MKLKKRFITTILVVIFLITTCTSTLAVSTSKDTTMSYLSQTVSSLLPSLESDASSYGFENVNFSNVKIGSEINAYKIGASSVEPTDYRIFPLFSDNRIFAICSLVTNTDGSPSITISKDYSDSLNSINSDFALLFSNNAVYAVLENGSYLHLQDINSPNQLTTVSFANAVAYVSQQCSSVSALSSVAYTPPSIRVINYNYLNVPVVRQYGEPLCWAACMASVINYFHGTSYSAMGIVNFLGVPVEEHNTLEVAGWLPRYWSIGTSIQEYKLNFATTVQYIDADVPLIALLTNSSAGAHMVVVRGYYHDVNTSVYQVSYMDSNYSTMRLTTFNSSGGFSIPINGYTYTQSIFTTTSY